MMKKNTRVLLLLFILFLMNGTAQISGYGFYRSLPEVNGQGYYRIPLDAQTLGKSKSSFSDFRVLKTDEADTSEVPYLLEWNEPLYSHEFTEEQLIDVSYKKGTASYITVKIKGNKEINSIKLLLNESDFDKTLSIQGSNDNKHWKTIKENIRIVGFGQQDFVFSTLYFPESSFDYYLITIDDKKTDPVTVVRALTRLSREQKAVYEKINDIYVVRKEIKKNLNPPPGKERVYKNYSEIKVTLPYQACLHSIQLKCRDKTADFYRTFEVSDSKGNVLSTGSFTSLEKDGITTVYLNNFIGTNLTIKVINNDNLPVDGIDVSVYGMNAFLISRLSPDEKYLIVYGKKNVRVPEYDLGYFSDKVKQLAKTITPGAETKVVRKIPLKKEAFFTDQKWLWIVLIILIMILGLFAFSLMKKVNKQ